MRITAIVSLFTTLIPLNYAGCEKHELSDIVNEGDVTTCPFSNQSLQSSLSTIVLQKLYAVKFLIYKNPGDVGVEALSDGSDILTARANYINGFSHGENYKAVFTVDSSNGYLN